MKSVTQKQEIVFFNVEFNEIDIFSTSKPESVKLCFLERLFF